MIRELFFLLLVISLSTSCVDLFVENYDTDINGLMVDLGYIINNNITALGQGKGLKMKSYMGRDYIAYPSGMTELQTLN